MGIWIEAHERKLWKIHQTLRCAHLLSTLLGQKLSQALQKGMHELPIPLRTPEMLLRSIETLVANLLNQKFENAHAILDQFCEHIHMGLDDIKNQTH